jgi:hypothetical protein
MRFAEKNAKLPDIKLSKLAAVRVEAFINTLKELRIDLKTLSLYLKRERGLSLDQLSDAFEQAGLDAMKGKTGEVARIAYRRAIDDAMARELRTAYNLLSKKSEAYYRDNQDRFEETYARYVNASLARVYNTRPPQYGTPRITTIRPSEISRVNISRKSVSRKDINRAIDRIDRNLTTLQRVGTVVRPAEIVSRTDTIRSVERIEPVIRTPLDRVDRTDITGKTPIVTISDKDIKDILKRKAPICWRQGIVWWVVKYPYRSRKDVYATRKKPQGAYEVKGIGSAYRTIQALGGEPQDVLINLDMGIVQARITGKSIAFKRVPKKKKVKNSVIPTAVRGIRI